MKRSDVLKILDDYICRCIDNSYTPPAHTILDMLEDTIGMLPPSNNESDGISMIYKWDEE